jgi:hypothetical protein
MDLLYFILGCFGLTQLLVYGKVFDKIRPSSYLFHCPMCIGFHVGWFLWAINGLTELFTFDYSITTAFVLAGVGSGSSYVLCMVFGDEGINLKIRGENND